MSRPQEVHIWHGGWGSLLMLTPGLAFLSAFAWRSSFESPVGRQFTLFDDAMISMTYARTLAETGEWVWFPGAARVQGFTNPLWTLWMAMIHAAGLEGSAAALTVTATGILLVLGCALLVARLVRLGLAGWRWGESAALIAGGSVPFLYPLTFWTLRGMEVGLLAFLSLLLVDRAATVLKRWQRGASATGPLLMCGVLGILGLATRLDFAIIAGGLSGLLFWWAPRSDAKGRVVTHFVLPLALAGICILFYQQWYYGDWVPNTFRLKMEGYSWWDRVSRGLAATGKAMPMLVMTLLGGAVTLAGSARELTRQIVISLATVVALMACYSIWVGADAWEWMIMLNRYVATSLPAFIAVVTIGLGHLMQTGIPSTRRLLPAATLIVVAGLGVGVATNPISYFKMPAAVFMVGLVCVIALCVISLGAVRGSEGRRWPNVVAIVSAAAAAVVVASLTAGFDALLTGTYPHVSDDFSMSQRGKELGRVTEPDAQVATMWAGAPAYYARRPMVDLLGKSDRRVANGPPALPPVPSGLAWFFPGHNKWDYDYSVGQLQPDVVFQAHTWDETLRQLAQWGYVERCLSDGTPIYARSDSAKVSWADLKSCPR